MLREGLNNLSLHNIFGEFTDGFESCYHPKNWKQHNCSKHKQRFRHYISWSYRIDLHNNLDITWQEVQNAAEAAFNNTGFWYMLKGKKKEREAAVSRLQSGRQIFSCLTIKKRLFDLYI